MDTSDFLDLLFSGEPAALFRLLEQDPILASDLAALTELDRQYEALPLTLRQRILINDYIACLNTVHSRARTLAWQGERAR